MQRRNQTPINSTQSTQPSRRSRGYQAKPRREVNIHRPAVEFGGASVEYMGATRSYPVEFTGTELIVRFLYSSNSPAHKFQIDGPKLLMSAPPHG